MLPYHIEINDRRRNSLAGIQQVNLPMVCAHFDEQIRLSDKQPLVFSSPYIHL